MATGPPPVYGTGGLGIDGQGILDLAAPFTGSITIGSVPLTSAGSSDIFVAKYTTGGQFLDAGRVGGTGTEQLGSLAVSGTNPLALAGNYTGSTDFGGNPLPDAPNGGYYVARLRLIGARWTEGDFNGDGTADPAVFRPANAQFFATAPGSGPILDAVPYGLPGDIPATGDFDGDDKTDLAVFRPGTGQWFAVSPVSGEVFPGGLRYGLPGDVPVVGDFSGDGRADLGVYRPGSPGRWFAVSPVAGAIFPVDGLQYGLGTDIPAIGDFSGDGKTDVALYRAGRWYAVSPVAGEIFPGGLPYGLPDDIPVTGDFNGDGRAELAVFRPGTGRWYAISPTSGKVYPGGLAYGQPGDIPLLASPAVRARLAQRI